MGLDIPINLDNIYSSAEAIPTKTPYIDLKTGKIIGYVDGLDAMKQAVLIILQTNRYKFLIFNSNFGSELKGIGGDQLYLKSELKRRICEALLQDDRITEVTDFTFEFSGDSAVVKFTVVTDHGTFGEEVTVSV